MKRRNQNRPSPFRGRTSYEATKPGFSFFVFILRCSSFLLIGHCVLLLRYSFSFSIPSQEMGLGERLRNDLVCVEWDVKP